MSRIIFHIDVNYFFARCEEIKNPSLETKPFVIAEKARRSVVSTSNYLARKQGIKSAMKLENCLKINPNLIIVKPDHSYYEQKSKELFKYIKQLLNCEIDIASIDECFIDVTEKVKEFHNNFEMLAIMIKKEILKNTKLYVTIGIGDTSFLAKTAGDLKPSSGIASIFSDELAEKLWDIPIQDIYMIGKKTNELLQQLDIKKVKDFINFHDQAKLKKLLMKRYDMLISFFINGGSKEFKIENTIRKSASSGTTFDINCDNKIKIYETINYLANEVFDQIEYERLRAINIGVGIKWKYKEGKIKSKTFDNYIFNREDFISNVYIIFNELWDELPLRSITIYANNLKPISLIYEQDKLF